MGAVAEGQNDERFTADDVAYLNRENMRDAAMKARIVGTVIMAIAVVAAFAWLWIEARQQLEGRGSIFLPSSFEGPTPTFAQRLDTLASGIGSLAIAAMTFGIGALVSLVARNFTVRFGGTLSGFEEGDEVIVETELEQ